MGNLVRFDKKGRSISAQEQPSGEGKVLIFTGVRYERTPAKSVRRKTRSSKRKQKSG